MIDGFRKASFASRLKIPIIYGLDVVHGAGPVNGATVFPHNIGLGATRDPALVEEVARAVAEESAGVGADFPFAPVVAVARDERWGRTYESFGETRRARLGHGRRLHQRLPEAQRPVHRARQRQALPGRRRDRERRQQRQHLGRRDGAARAAPRRPTRPWSSAGVGSIMASYSSWQGTRMHANTTMITGVLKGELGFAGFVGSDYNGCYQNGVNLGGCLNAGVDMFMTFGPNASQFLSMVRGLVPSTVPQARIDDAARRILVAKCEMGLLDGTQRLVDRTLTAQVGSAAHRAVARRAVAASMVVLKNDGGALPLSKTVAGVALGGKTADNIGNQCGGWTVTWQGMTGDRHHGRDHRPAGAGGVLTSGQGQLRAGRVGDRQRRDRRHRRHRRDAVLRRVRRHPRARRAGRRA